MSIDPSLALQRAITGLLNSDADVKALIGLRVYDDVPPTDEFPYASFGPSQINSQDADCLTGFEVFLQIDIWSRELGFEEAKAVSEAVRKSLHNSAVTQDGLTFDIEHRFTNTNRDPDGVTNHAVLSFRAEIYTEEN